MTDTAVRGIVRALLVTTMLGWGCAASGSERATTAGGDAAAADVTTGGAEGSATDLERRDARMSEEEATPPVEEQMATPDVATEGPGVAPPQIHDEDAVAPRASLALLRQLDRVESGLPRALSAGRCSDAGGIRDHICALASRVCALAGAEPEDEMLDSRCEDARRRCQSATTRVAERCGS